MDPVEFEPWIAVSNRHIRPFHVDYRLNNAGKYAFDNKKGVRATLSRFQGNGEIVVDEDDLVVFKFTSGYHEGTVIIFRPVKIKIEIPENLAVHIF